MKTAIARTEYIGIPNQLFLSTQYNNASALGVNPKKELLQIQSENLSNSDVDDLERRTDFKPLILAKESLKNFATWYKKITTQLIS